MNEPAHYRIGELERRTGVAGATLRAWERRYGVLDPTRTDGGHRLYSDEDVERVQRVQRLVEQGWSVGSAAEAVRANQDLAARTSDLLTTVAPADGDATGAAARLLEVIMQGLRSWDQTAIDRALDEAFALLDLPAAVDLVVLPAVRRSAQGWRDDPGVIAREHFLSNLLRPRLRRVIALTAGRRLTAVAAAPEDDEHDLGLLAAAAVLATRGVAVRYLGARTPVTALEQAVADTDADVVLVATVFRTSAQRWLDATPRLGHATVILGGAGFVPADADRLAGATVHEGSLTDLAERIQGLLRAG